jgi:hypothetical protein
MRDSKALKPGNQFEDREDDKKTPTWLLNLRLWWWDFAPVRWYYDVGTFIRRLKRAYKWTKNCIWTNWDFDAQTIFPLLEYKLKRIEFCLKNGHAVQEERDLKALRISIKLAKRVSDDYHEGKLYEWHERKWGGHTPWRESWEDQGDGSSRYVGRRVKVKTEQDREAEVADLRALWAKNDAWRSRDEKLLFSIIQKYYRVWWD